MRISLPLLVTTLARVVAGDGHDELVVVPSFSSLVPIPDTTLQLVKENVRSSSHQSWELGTMAEAYLECGESSVRSQIQASK